MKVCVSFRCPVCSARIKAPVQLIGQNRSCPRCSHHFTVPRQIPRDETGPVLVVDDRASSREAQSA